MHFYDLQTHGGLARRGCPGAGLWRRARIVASAGLTVDGVQISLWCVLCGDLGCTCEQAASAPQRGRAADLRQRHVLQRQPLADCEVRQRLERGCGPRHDCREPRLLQGSPCKLVSHDGALWPHRHHTACRLLLLDNHEVQICRQSKNCACNLFFRRPHDALLPEACHHPRLRVRRPATPHMCSFSQFQ